MKSILMLRGGVKVRLPDGSLVPLETYLPPVYPWSETAASLSAGCEAHRMLMRGRSQYTKKYAALTQLYVGANRLKVTPQPLAAAEYVRLCETDLRPLPPDLREQVQCLLAEIGRALE